MDLLASPAERKREASVALQSNAMATRAGEARDSCIIVTALHYRTAYDAARRISGNRLHANRSVPDGYDGINE